MQRYPDLSGSQGILRAVIGPTVWRDRATIKQFWRGRDPVGHLWRLKPHRTAQLRRGRDPIGQLWSCNRTAQPWRTVALAIGKSGYLEPQ